MRIIQVVSTLSFGDAIGNHIVMLRQAIHAAGYATDIRAEFIDDRFPRGTAKRLSRSFQPGPGDIVLYHLSYGCALNLRLRDWRCRRILVYHNITPPHFCERYGGSFADGLREGLRHVSQLRGHVERCVAMSAFNKHDLLTLGYPEHHIWVMPSYLIPFADYGQPPNPAVLAKYADDCVNILFVGRIAPNKKHEDVVRAFAYYQKHVNAQSRLLLVGDTAVEAYANAVRAYIRRLGVRDVVFAGHVDCGQLIAYYRSAHIFLCMSEHEGFCVPLAEAMHFDIPVLAYGAAAVPDTLGGSGLLLDGKDPVMISACVQRVLQDTAFRDAILAGQRRRLEQFRPDEAAAAFTQYLSQIMQQ